MPDSYEAVNGRLNSRHFIYAEVTANLQDRMKTTDLQSKDIRMIHRRNIAILFVFVIGTGISVALYMHSADRYSLLYYGDAVSHLIGARKLFDWSENPGWAQIGTVWLPLPHFLLMFPSMIDSLFFSGFAGLAVSLPCLALSSILIYKIVIRVLTRVSNINNHIITYAGFSVALLYALNPSFLYLGITAMTEMPFMLLFLACAYFLLRWHEELNHHNSHAAFKYLFLCSIFTSAATLCRYEGWILPLFIISFAPITILVKRLRQKNDVSQEPGQDSTRNAKTTSSTTIAFTIFLSIFSFSGIVFWLTYNAVNYGYAFEFANAQYYSAASQAVNRSFRENLFLEPYNVTSVYGWTAFQTYGPTVLGAAAIGYLAHRRIAEHKRIRSYLFLLLALPPVFTITSLLIGIGEMSYWFNSRFMILTAPLLMLLLAFFIAKQPRKIVDNRILLVAVIASLFAFHIAAPTFGSVVTLADAKGGFEYGQAPYTAAVGDKIKQLYDGNGLIMIMTGSAQEHRILISSGIQLHNYDSIIESSTWKKSFYEPWNHGDRFIIMAKEPDSDAVTVIKYWKDHRALLDGHYHQVFENKYYEILSQS